MKAIKYFDSGSNRLVYVKRAATEEFWDELWQERFSKKRYQFSPNSMVVKVTRKYLPEGGRVLEGGCGLAEKSVWLKHAGYDAVALDFAPETVAMIKAEFPGLESMVGDVRALDLPTGSLDGYWSLGVIEHFWNGYHAIRDEMHRVIRPGGYLFLTFPYMSPLRRLRAKVGGYPTSPATEPPGFYQFALDSREVSADFVRHGFEQVERRPFLGLRGLEDEFGSIGLDRMRKGRGKAFGALINKGIEPFTSHCVLLVFQRR